MSGSNHLKMNQNQPVIRANLKKIKDPSSREFFNPIIVTNCSIEPFVQQTLSQVRRDPWTQITKLITLIPVVEQLTHTISSKRTSNLFQWTKNSIEATPKKRGTLYKASKLIKLTLKLLLCGMDRTGINSSYSRNESSIVWNPEVDKLSMISLSLYDFTTNNEVKS